MKNIIKNITNEIITIEDLGFDINPNEYVIIFEDISNSLDIKNNIDNDKLVFLNDDLTEISSSESKIIIRDIQYPVYESNYSKNEIDQKFADLVNTAPETLNQLNELAAALDNDPNFATTITTELSHKADINHNHDTLYSSILHEHNNLYYKISDVDDMLNSKSNTNHNHDDRYVKFDDLPSQTIFGKNFNYIINNDVIINSSNEPYIHSELIVNVTETGTYRISVNYTWAYDSTSRDFIATFEQLYNNENEILLFTHREEPKDAAGRNGNIPTNQQKQHTWFKYLNLIPGEYKYTLYFYGEDRRKVSAMWDSVIEFWRVS